MSVTAGAGRGEFLSVLCSEGESLVKVLVAAAQSVLKATDAAVSDPSGWVAPSDGSTGRLPNAFSTIPSLGDNVRVSLSELL